VTRQTDPNRKHRHGRSSKQQSRNTDKQPEVARSVKELGNCTINEKVRSLLFHYYESPFLTATQAAKSSPQFHHGKGAEHDENFSTQKGR
jgi:cytochrome c1